MEVDTRLKEQLQQAARLLDKRCKELLAPKIPENLQEAAEQLLRMGLIELKTKPIRLQRDLYFPTITAKEFTNISYKTWGLMLIFFMMRHKIHNKFSLTTAAEYNSRWDLKYAAAASTNGIWDDKAVCGKDELGSKWLKLEELAWLEVRKEYEEEEK